MTDPTNLVQPPAIVTLLPYVLDILSSWGIESAIYVPPSEGNDTQSERSAKLAAILLDSPFLGASAPNIGADMAAIIQADPHILITESTRLQDVKERQEVERELAELIGHHVKIVALGMRTLDGAYQSIEQLGKLVGQGLAARDLCNRIKAQLMDWCDSFYERMKSKRVTVLSSVQPLTVAGRWVPDIIKACSGIPQSLHSETLEQATSWTEISQFRPDVIVVAPYGATLQDSVATLAQLESIEGWDTVPAVKRGEVIFTDGNAIYRPGPQLVRGLGILVSAVAGLESGYITERDSFYRLRWVELHRHRFAKV